LCWLLVSDARVRALNYLAAAATSFCKRGESRQLSQKHPGGVRVVEVLAAVLPAEKAHKVEVRELLIVHSVARHRARAQPENAARVHVLNTKVAQGPFKICERDGLPRAAVAEGVKLRGVGKPPVVDLVHHVSQRCSAGKLDGLLVSLVPL
jgi:hypothetical protein